jgi:hypothetical protein
MKHVLTVAALAGAAGILMVAVQSVRGAGAEPDSTNREVERKIWKLLDDDKAVYVSLAEADFRALGEGFDLPDGGTTVTDLAQAAPGGAFDPRNLEKIQAWL